jgi:hypothetical protein
MSPEHFADEPDESILALAGVGDVEREAIAGELAPDSGEIVIEITGVSAKNGAASREAAPEASELAAEPPTGAIASAWVHLDVETFTEPPPPRRWLLRHPTRDGQPCAPATGDGLLPLGKTGLLVSDGGVGKTNALLQLAVSIITGRKWLDHFEIGHEARKGRVLLALAEEDSEEVRRRLFEIARAYKLTPDECARVVARIVVLPLAGKDVSMLAYGGRDGRLLLASDELVALRERLIANAGEEGWCLIGLDPFARWAPGDAERDNSIATRTVEAFESLLVVPGNPAVLVAHHASADGVIGKDGAPLKARGVTGIRNGFRWEATLAAMGPDVYFRQSKSNYSRPMNDAVRLVRGPGGVLRVPNEHEQQEHAARLEEQKTSKTTERDASHEARVLATMDGMLAAVRAATSPLTSRAQIVGLGKGAKDIREDALARLLAGGRIVSQGEGRERVYVVSEFAAT